MPREYKLYLEDILSSIQKIKKYTRTVSFEQFTVSSLIQDAVVRNLEIIGEAVKNIPAEVREMKKDIDWRSIAGLRDILSHAYFTIDLDILWEIISDKLPELEEATKDLLRQI
ncbi:MAG: HepT-like ribonuclease domain-containing protein [Candidatus Heimdallarchaeaceae archaeon]